MFKTILLVVALMLFACAASSQMCSPACDIDGDGSSARPGDYITFFGSLGKSPGDPGYVAAADLDNSGSVTSVDWGMMLKFCPLGK